MLPAKIYEVDPFVCPRMHARAPANDQRKRGGDMKVIAVIEDSDELKRILRHLVKIG